MSIRSITIQTTSRIGRIVVPTTGNSNNMSNASFWMTMNRFTVSVISYPQQRRMIMTMKPYHQQQQQQVGKQKLLRLVRWNSNNTTIPTGRPPSPRLYPSTATITASASASASASSTNSSTTAASSLYARTNNRGPVSWTSLFIITIAAASAVTYYQIERERRLERAMGKIVSSEYNGTAMTNTNANINDENTNATANIKNEDGWTPRPGYLAKRKFIATPSGWFPVDDGFGAREWSLFHDLFIYFSRFVVVS